jgi:hypothetical protein
MLTKKMPEIVVPGQIFMYGKIKSNYYVNERDERHKHQCCYIFYKNGL